jgi:hypothetical protein
MVDQVDERRIEYMRLSEVQSAPRNPKTHAGDEIRQSLTKFGIADLPVVDDRSGRLVSGHGRLEQLSALHRARPDRPPRGVRTDPQSGEWLVPVVRGWSSDSDAEAEAYLLTANQTTILGGWDDAELAAIVRDLADLDAELLAVTALGEDRIEDLLASLEDEVEIVHDDIPATQAGYAETPDEEARREERIAGYEPRAGAQTGFTEMILVYTNEDREEAGRLIAAARDVLGADMRAAEVVLRALRTLTVVLDCRHDPRPVDVKSLLRAAGTEDTGGG